MIFCMPCHEESSFDGIGPVRFGVAGLGGFASYVTERLLDDARLNCPSAQLVGACDPDIEQFVRRARELRARGVTVVRDFHELLSLDIDAVWLPLPIDLHRPFTEAALAAGKAVLCEKPAAGSVQDVDAMIAARNRTGLCVLVGFQDLYQPNVALVKRRMLDREFGRPISASVIGCWARGDAYFRRNGWAGRLQREGRWVMDSPALNALAHFLHLPLYLLGASMDEAADPLTVQAELYRANSIENYDTCSMRIMLPGDVPLVAGFTHACDTTVEPRVTIETEHARITYLAYRHIEIQSKASLEKIPLSDQPHRHMLATFKSCLHNPRLSPPRATLEMSRAHLTVVNAASQAAPVIDVPAEFVQPVHDSEDNVLRTIRQIVPALQASVRDKCMLHETAMAPWASAARSLSVVGYKHFRGPHEMLKDKAPAAAAAEPSLELTIAPRRKSVRA